MWVPGICCQVVGAPLVGARFFGGGMALSDDLYTLAVELQFQRLDTVVEEILSVLQRQIPPNLPLQREGLLEELLKVPLQKGGLRGICLSVTFISTPDDSSAIPADIRLLDQCFSFAKNKVGQFLDLG